MSASTALPYKPHRLSVADYYRMAEVGILSVEDHVELIEGELIDMPPIGILHAGTVDYLVNLLSLAAGKQAIIRTQNPIVLGLFSEPQPDITLLRARADYYRSSHPGPADILLIIEVADTTLRFDREFKIPLYAQHGIPESWVVDLNKQLLHVYRQPAGGRYLEQQCQADPCSWVPVMLPGCSLDLTKLWG
ncbi:MAG: Uma2 family endonuclease [Methylococcales bacterium]